MGNYHTSQFMQVTDVTLMVSNIERSLKFYHENMGFKLLNKNDNFYELGTHTGRKLITLIYNPLATPKCVQPDFTIMQSYYHQEKT